MVVPANTAFVNNIVDNNSVETELDQTKRQNKDDFIFFFLL